jgi:hypothetical protein
MERARIDAVISLLIQLCDSDTTLDQMAGYVDALEFWPEEFPEARPADVTSPADRRIVDTDTLKQGNRGRATRRASTRVAVIAPAARTTAYLMPVAAAAASAQIGGSSWATLVSSLPAEAFRRAVSQ